MSDDEMDEDEKRKWPGQDAAVVVRDDRPFDPVLFRETCENTCRFLEELANTPSVQQAVQNLVFWPIDGGHYLISKESLDGLLNSLRVHQRIRRG